MCLTSTGRSHVSSYSYLTDDAESHFLTLGKNVMLCYKYSDPDPFLIIEINTGWMNPATVTLVSPAYIVRRSKAHNGTLGLLTYVIG